MNTKKNGINDCNGTTLVVVMLMTTLCTVAASSVLFSVGSKVSRGYKQVNMEQAFYVAEAGMERAAAWVAAPNDESKTFTGNFGDGSYVAKVTVQSLSAGEIGYEIASVGTVDGTSRTVTVRGLQRLSWARYALWYDQDPHNLYIGAGDTFSGRFYSRPQLRFTNSGINTRGQAHFLDNVWTVATTISKQSGAEPIFDKQLFMGVEAQVISTVDFNELQAHALKPGGSGLLLTGDATIVMDGATMKITNGEREWTDEVVAIPTNAIVYVKGGTYTKKTYDKMGKVTSSKQVTEPGDITVSGPKGMKGQMTLVSDRDIKIVDHIKYKTDPMNNPDANDKLGLIAKRDTLIQKAAPNNVFVYAHIFCRDGGFGVYEYNKGSYRGTLTIYGGIANLIRNPVATGTSTGYTKDYIYDGRFAHSPPPYYPRLTDQLEWEGWEG